jgi:two-component system response regulator YesN
MNPAGFRRRAFPTRDYLPPILIVDDEKDDIDLLRRRLRDAGVPHPVLPFVNSAEALDFLRALPNEPEAMLLQPAVMFLDINMPVVHGFVFLKWVRSQADLDDMQVIMVSGSDKPADRERALKLGADAYLVKFPEPAMLKATLCRLATT